MSKATWQRTCFHCRRLFEVQVDPPPIGSSWYFPKANIYCEECEDAWERAHSVANLAKLELALEAGEIVASRHGEPLNFQDLADVAPGLTESLPIRLEEAGIKISPSDWWHLHLSRVAGALSFRNFTLKKEDSVLVEVVGPGHCVPWTRPAQELPLKALPEILKTGAVWKVVEALDLKGKCPRNPGLVRKVARERLGCSDPRVRFESLWLLMLIDLDGTLHEFLTMAADESEHPRIRGLALEGIKESLDRAPRSAPWASRALKLVEHLLSDPEPEVRWWCCYVASHLSTGNSIRGRRYRYRSNDALLPALRRLLDDHTPSGLGWSISREAKDAVANLEGRGDYSEHPMWYPYDPWGVV